MAFKGEQSDSIILNSTRGRLENQFDCGHELIHLYKHRNSEIDYFNCFEKTHPVQNSFIEWEANEGSAELIVPMCLLLPEIKKRSFKSWSDINSMKFELSDLFKVSHGVMQFRIESLKYEINQYLNGASLKDIKILSATAQKQRGIHVKSLNTIEDEMFSAELTKWKQTKKKPGIDVYKI